MSLTRTPLPPRLDPLGIALPSRVEVFEDRVVTEGVDLAVVGRSVVMAVMAFEGGAMRQVTLTLTPDLARHLGAALAGAAARAEGA